MEKLLIFPYNGNGLEAIDCIGNQYELIGFIDDTPEKLGKTAFGVEVFGREILSKYPDAKVLAVPGSPLSFKIRAKIIQDLNINENRFATVIHPNASVSNLAKVGKNVLIMAGVVLTSNCKIGNHVCILPNSVIHHDSEIKEYTLVGGNAIVAGGVVIEENCYIGSGSNIINGISIGKETLVGMGSNVITNIPAQSKVVGNPAKMIN